MYSKYSVQQCIIHATCSIRGKKLEHFSQISRKKYTQSKINRFDFLALNPQKLWGEKNSTKVHSQIQSPCKHASTPGPFCLYVTFMREVNKSGEHRPVVGCGVDLKDNNKQRLSDRSARSVNSCPVKETTGPADQALGWGRCSSEGKRPARRFVKGSF